jgi:hypothetical protein
MRKAPGHGVAWCPFAATPAAPLVRLGDPAREHSTVGFESLTSDYETELV